MSMKEKIKIVGDEVKLPETIKLHEISTLEGALDRIVDEGMRNDLKRMTIEEVSRKYGLTLSYVAMIHAELKTPEVFQIKEKKKDK